MVAALGERDAVVAVDVQRDFCPGGALPVPRGDSVVGTLNRWIDQAVDGGGQVVISRDWHPPGHVSFRDKGGPWPPHCVQDSAGASLHPDLRVPATAIRVDKGTEPDRDNYSAFDGTGLAESLREVGVERIWVGGLALDYCVLATALDGLGHGFEVHLIPGGTLPVEASPGDGERALQRLLQAGVVVEG
jgi:nicotinamidase/pyrazinamidase